MAKGYRSICFWRYYRSDVGYNHQQRPCPIGKTLMIFWHHADLDHRIPSLLSGCLCSGVITCCCGFSELLHWISFLVMSGELYLSWTLPSFIPQCTATGYFSVKHQIISCLILRSISGFRLLGFMVPVLCTISSIMKKHRNTWIWCKKCLYIICI